MGSFLIVVGEPALKKCVPCFVRPIELGVGPPVNERTDEGLGLAVGLRAVGLGHVVTDTQLLESPAGEPPLFTGDSVV